MKHYRIEEIASEIEIARVGNSGSHYLLCPCAFCEGLRDNADVVDTGLAQGIDDGSECPEGHRLIAPQEYTSLSALQLRMNLRAKLESTQRSVFLRCDETRSEEHTSELQSHLNLVCRLLLEKKKSQPYRSYI